MRGYFVETNVPVGTGEKGGRKEADIVGFRFVEGKPEILHIEITGSSEGREDMLKIARSRFERKRVETLISRIESAAGVRVDPRNYWKVFVTLYLSIGPRARVFWEIKDELAKEGIKVVHMAELLPCIISEVKDRVVTEEGHRTLPQSWSTLKVIEYLVAEQIVSLNRSCSLDVDDLLGASNRGRGDSPNPQLA